MKETIPSRRYALSGTLAIGVSMFIPTILSGCGARQGSEPTGAGPASPPSTGAETALPATTGKAAPASVRYQGQPKGAQKCGTCMHLIAETNTCEVVDGLISPEGWCSLWIGKA